MPSHPISRRHMLTFALAAPVSLSITGCGSLDREEWQAPVARLLSLQLQGIRQGVVNLGMGLSLFNPNTRSLPELGLDLGLSLAEQAIATFATDTPFSLPAEGEAQVDLNVGINALSTVTTLLSLANQDEIPYTISGRAISPQLGGLSLPVSLSGAVDLAQVGLAV